ncbi:MAG: class I SAM-dependent methyltransferase [Cyanobacteria bacterium P01_A01_bin.84]
MVQNTQISFKFYQEDLAYIHDVGFSDYALKSTSGILAILQKYQIPKGLIVELGCGSGLSAQEFIKASYQVWGVDISEEMINIAKTRVQDAEFVVSSVFDVEIPPCHAAIAIGECFNYLFDEVPNVETLGIESLKTLFHRVYDALIGGGVFIFDIAEPGQVKPGTTVKGFTEGEDWIVLFEKEENQDILTRHITTFRKLGEDYRRHDEVHLQRLYKGTEIAEILRQIGFEVEISDRYDSFKLPLAHIAFIAHKKL